MSCHDGYGIEGDAVGYITLRCSCGFVQTWQNPTTETIYTALDLHLGDPVTYPRFVLHHRRSRITRKLYWWFTLVDGGNNKVVATSESYTSEAGARNGIQAVRDAAPNAEVVEK